MTRGRIDLSEEQLRAAHRSLDTGIAFEVASQNPNLLVCITNLAESRARASARRAAQFDIKLAIAGDTQPEWNQAHATRPSRIEGS